MSAKGTSHHRMQGLTGLVTIVLLPIVLVCLAFAVRDGLSGLASMLSTVWMGVMTGVFLVAATWYCKLQFDEVVMDYFSGGVRAFGLLLNRIVGVLIIVASVYSIFTLIQGA